MTTVEVLQQAKQLIATSGWTQGCSARNSVRIPVTVMAEAAVAFCATGAIERVVRVDGGDPHPLKYDAIEYLARALHRPDTVGRVETITRYNDALQRTVADVLALYDQAIALAEVNSLS
jgi:hypothetical protein